MSQSIPSQSVRTCVCALDRGPGELVAAQVHADLLSRVESEEGGPCAHLGTGMRGGPVSCATGGQYEKYMPVARAKREAERKADTRPSN